MPGKQAAEERREAAEYLLEAARSLCPIQSAIRAVFKPQYDIPDDMRKLMERLQ